MPTLSVIVPVYRSYPRIIECIDSILAQTFTDFELILIDDCTPDIESKNYCDEIAQKDNRIKVFHLDRNRGIAGARNFGLEQATGEFIHFSDADDFVAPTMYEECIANLRKTNADIICTPVTNTDILNNKSSSCSLIPGVFSEKQERWNTIKHLLQRGAFFDVWDKIYSRKITMENNIRFNEHIFASDTLTFNAQFFQYVKKISLLNKNFYTWYCNWTSSQGSKKQQYVKDHAILLDIFYNFQKSYNAFSYEDKIIFTQIFIFSCEQCLKGKRLLKKYKTFKDLIILKNKYKEMIITFKRNECPGFYLLYKSIEKGSVVRLILSDLYYIVKKTLSTIRKNK